MLPRSENPVYVESDVDSMIERANNPKQEVDRDEVKAMLYYLKGMSTGNRALKKIVLVLSICFVGGMAALFGVAYLANEYAKDYRIANSQMTSLDGGLIAVANAEKYGDLYSLPTHSLETLANLKEISCFVDMTSIPEVNGWTQSTFKVMSTHKKVGTQVAFFKTSTSDTIKIDAATQVATLTTGGTTLPISETLPANLNLNGASPALKNRRKLGRRGATTDTGGSFTMSSGSNRSGND